MLIRQTSCCALYEISGISMYSGRAYDAMIELCKLIYPREDSQAAAFYLFTGVIGYRKGSNIGRNPPTYVDDFTKFIKERGLGDVIATPPAFNRTGHPTHRDRVCVWTPAPIVLKQWWMEHKPAAFITKKRPY